MDCALAPLWPPQEWSFLQNYSPYHNIVADADYPSILFTTSTRDDRVHPAHARKAVRKLADLGKEKQKLARANTAATKLLDAFRSGNLEKVVTELEKKAEAEATPPPMEKRRASSAASLALAALRSLDSEKPRRG